MENIIFIVIAVLGWIIRLIIKKRKAEKLKDRVNYKEDFFAELKRFSNQLILNSPVSGDKSKHSEKVMKLESNNEHEIDQTDLAPKLSSRKNTRLNIKNKIKDPNYLKEAFLLKEVLEKKF